MTICSKALVRRSFVRALLVGPVALAFPGWAVAQPMSVHDAIKALSNGVFHSAEEWKHSRR